MAEIEVETEMENHEGAERYISSSIHIYNNSYDTANDEGEYAFAIHDTKGLER